MSNPPSDREAFLKAILQRPDVRALRSASQSSKFAFALSRMVRNFRQNPRKFPPDRFTCLVDLLVRVHTNALSPLDAVRSRYSSNPAAIDAALAFTDASAAQSSDQKRALAEQVGGTAVLRRMVFEISCATYLSRAFDSFEKKEASRARRGGSIVPPAKRRNIDSTSSSGSGSGGGGPSSGMSVMSDVSEVQSPGNFPGSAIPVPGPVPVPVPTTMATMPAPAPPRFGMKGMKGIVGRKSVAARKGVARKGVAVPVAVAVAQRGARMRPSPGSGSGSGSDHDSDGEVSDSKERTQAAERISQEKKAVPSSKVGDKVDMAAQKIFEPENEEEMMYYQLAMPELVRFDGSAGPSAAAKKRPGKKKKPKKMTAAERAQRDIERLEEESRSLLVQRSVLGDLVERVLKGRLRVGDDEEADLEDFDQEFEDLSVGQGVPEYLAHSVECLLRNIVGRLVRICDFDVEYGQVEEKDPVESGRTDVKTADDPLDAEDLGEDDDDDDLLSYLVGDGARDTEPPGKGVVEGDFGGSGLLSFIMSVDEEEEEEDPKRVVGLNHLVHFVERDAVFSRRPMLLDKILRRVK